MASKAIVSAAFERYSTSSRVLDRWHPCGIQPLARCQTYPGRHRSHRTESIWLFSHVHSVVSASLPEYSRWIRWDRWEEVHQDGLLVELEVKAPNSENVVSYERLLSWKELGTTLDLYEEYGHLSNKAEPIPRRSASVLVAKWGEGAMQAGLPTVADICCQIVATDAGYVGLSVILPAGAYPIPSFLETWCILPTA